MYTRTTQFLDICEFEILGAYADTVNEMTTAVKLEGPLRVLPKIPYYESPVDPN